jgi:metal-responsive CopG/Arc/MetJ family transcriptional regulator
MRAAVPHKRINISLPEPLLRLLDDVAPKNRRSQFIAQAVEEHIAALRRHELRERLKAGYLANAKADRQLAEEWATVEQEAYDYDVEGEMEKMMTSSMTTAESGNQR